MRTTPPSTRHSRLIAALAALAVLGGLVALGVAFESQWWKRGSTVDVAGLAEAPRGKFVRLEYLIRI